MDQEKESTPHAGLFKKGTSGNPNGRPKMPDYLRRGKRMNKVMFQDILQKYISCNLHSLKAKLENAQRHDSKISAMEVTVIKVIVEAIKSGDTKRLDFILDRLIGKVTEHVEITGDMEITKKVDLGKLDTRDLDVMEKLLKRC